MLRAITAQLEGTIITNDENRLVLKVEEMGDFGIHSLDLDKLNLKQGKKQKVLHKASGLCFFYAQPFEGLAGYVYPAYIQILNDKD